MIVVNCAAEQSEVIKLLEEYDGEIHFTFCNKEGIKLRFNVNTDDIESAILKAKEIIKASNVGKALYFSVTK